MNGGKGGYNQGYTQPNYQGGYQAGGYQVTHTHTQLYMSYLCPFKKKKKGMCLQNVCFYLTEIIYHSLKIIIYKSNQMEKQGRGGGGYPPQYGMPNYYAAPMMTGPMMTPPPTYGQAPMVGPPLDDGQYMVPAMPYQGVHMNQGGMEKKRSGGKGRGKGKGEGKGSNIPPTPVVQSTEVI